LKLGNGLVETTTYNTRFQPTSIQLGSVMTLGFTYGSTAALNNGNVSVQTIAGSGLGSSITQNYAYDGANRLQSFSETGNTSNQTYCYDPYGNRSVVTGGWIPYPGQTPTNNSGCTAGVFPKNQWAAGSGVTYDASGNQTGITSAGSSFTYDAEK
jgi:YD repeat-containing protein